MKTVILKCKPYSLFHSGKVAYDENMSLNDTSYYFHSDTLFSALVNIFNRVKPDKTNEFVEQFENDNIKISSVFYCLEKGDAKIFFVPSPADSVINVDSKNLKEIKRISFVSQKVFESDLVPEQWIDDNHCKVIGKRFVITNDEYKAFFGNAESDDIPIINTSQAAKVKVHGVSQTDSMYHQAAFEIADLSMFGVNISMYFMYETKTNFADWENKFRLTLDLLPKSGLGGQRSSGCGFFEGIEYTENTFAQAGEGRNMSVSLSIPAEGEFTQFKAYHLLTRGGRDAGHNRGTLKTVRTIAEGAIVENIVKGSIADIKPDKSPVPYLRNGKTMLIACKPDKNKSA